MTMTNREFKDWRTRRGLSQGKLAKALGVRSVTVSRWGVGDHSYTGLASPGSGGPGT